MQPIITSQDVKLSYGAFEALHGIDLDFNQNEITALIGPSGCGKSTYLRCLNRMNDLIEGVTITGSFKLKDLDMYAEDTDVVELRRQVGMVFQQPIPFPMSIFDNVSYGLKLNGRPDKNFLEERVEESLKQAALWDEVKDDLNKSALELSGGQQQRISIARVLAVRPDVILMDEPTSALDPISSAQIEDTLLQLKKEYTIIMVTHNMQQATRVSDKTAFFNLGNLIEADSTEKIFMNPAKQETDDYINGKFG
ncbi:phosphate ABC transporter ATP-binding protein PstB [Paucilactobacillus nenjiangensis]|jgi:phosphate transport system ATP-binding protein|uniref:phosphate ABC transporter ATP-binding protein PstB n=1 Tax=Paucilactobacillus nenjiangensis TaxID=1296540 RepID=UPI0010F7F358